MTNRRKRRDGGRLQRLYRWASQVPVVRTISFLLVPLALAGVFCAAASAGYHGYHAMVDTTVFSVDAIDIKGLPSESAAALRQQLGWAERRSLLVINLEKIERDLQNNPWIRAVNVRRLFPHTLQIEVRTHQAAAVVLVGKHFYLCNNQGKLFARATSAEASEFVVISGVQRRHGQRRSQTLKRILDAYRRFASAGQRSSDAPTVGISGLPRLGEIHLERDGSLIFYSGQGRIAFHLGNDVTVQKVSRLARLWRMIRDDRERIRDIYFEKDTADISAATPGALESIAASVDGAGETTKTSRIVVRMRNQPLTLGVSG